ncbi:MAG: hypothetical protein V2A69_13575 [Pseudomonadota bacterium]
MSSLEVPICQPEPFAHCHSEGVLRHVVTLSEAKGLDFVGLRINSATEESRSGQAP